MMRGLRLYILGICLLASAACNQVEARVNADRGYRSYLAKKFDESIQFYESARAASPNNKTILKNLGYAYLGAAREEASKDKSRLYTDNAIKILTDLLTKDPKDLELASVMLDAWMQADRLDDAARFFEARLAEDSKDIESLRLLGMIEMQRGNYEAALNIYEKRKQLTPDNIQIYASIATLSWEWLRVGGPNDPVAAVEVATRGLNAALEANTKDPKHPTALVYAGLLLRERAKRQIDQKEAEKDLAAAQDIFKKVKEKTQSTDSQNRKPDEKNK